MGLHDLEFFSGQLSRFQKNPIGDSDFPDIVQRARMINVCDPIAADRASVPGVHTQAGGQQPAIGLNTFQMHGGFIVAGFGQFGDRKDRFHLRVGNFLYLKVDQFVKMAVIGFDLLLEASQSDMRVNAGLHFFELERLRNVIDAACPKAQKFVLRVVHSAEENHGDRRKPRIRFEPVADFVSGHLGHIDIQKNQVRWLFGGGQQRHPAPRERAHIVPSRKQHSFH